MAYIIDTYNKYNKWDRDHSLHIFTINDKQYAIKEVMLNWGQPQIPTPIDRDVYPETYFIYKTYEDALEFVQRMRSLN